MNNPKIAVLLAAYNGGEWIGEQFDSILNQKSVAVTIFVSIDPSTDNTVAVCEQYAKLHSNIIILADAGRFGGAAKNFFRLIRDVDLSGFDYMSFSDQDDIWYEDKLTRAVQQVAGDKAVCYSSNVLAFWPNGEQRVIVKSQPQREWDYLFEAAGPGCTYVLPVAFVEQLKKVIVSKWTEVNKLGLHDWFSYAYARAHGFKWIIDAQPSMLYRQHESNQVGVNRGWRAFWYRINKVAGSWGIQQSALIAGLVGQGDAPFVKSWSDFSRLGFVKLAFQANQCRRKLAERGLFFCAALLMALVGKR